MPKTNEGQLLKGLSGLQDQEQSKRAGGKKHDSTSFDYLMSEPVDRKKTYTFSLSREVADVLDAMANLSDKKSRSMIVEKILAKEFKNFSIEDFQSLQDSKINANLQAALDKGVIKG